MSRRGEMEVFPIPAIPKVIHQIWIPNWTQVPASIKHTREAWVRLNPTWKYKFWDEEDIENLLYSSFKFLKPLWKKLKGERLIKKADLARIMVLQKEGGLYVDMDLVPIIPMKINPIFTQRYFGCLEHDFSGNERMKNGFIGAPHGSEPLMRCLKECESRIYYPVLEFMGPGPVSSYLLPEKPLVYPHDVILSDKIAPGILCMNLDSRSWGEPELGQAWYRS